MAYNPKIHKRRSIRLKDYDYSQEGAYFITICTKNRECLFGDVVGGKMVLNEIGEIVDDEWNKTQYLRKNVELDEYVVMPNHLHGILTIDDVGARRGVPLQQSNRFGTSISNSLGIIVNHFKSAVKRWCNKNNHEYFQWQRNYYEHAIRNENELNRIREYIVNNPLEWAFDRNNPNNIKKLIAYN